MIGADLYELTPEQREIQALCHDFAEKEIRPVTLAADEADPEMRWEVWYKAAGLGITAFMLPDEYGGAGMTDVFTQCLVQEELCFGCAGIGNLLTSGGFLAEPVLELGTEGQKLRWLRPLSGERPPPTALATTEPGAGFDAAPMQTTESRVDGGYVFRGDRA